MDCAIISLVSIGDDGSWLRSWATRRVRKVSWSIPCLGAAAGVDPAYRDVPAVWAAVVPSIMDAS